MIYSPRAQPEVNKSHIPEVPKNNRLIFHMGEVSTVAENDKKHAFLRCFDVGTLKEKNFSGFTLNNSKKVSKDALGFPHCKNL